MLFTSLCDFVSWDPLFSLFPMAEEYSSMYTSHTLIVSLHYGWIPCLICILAAVSCTTVNMGVQVSLHLLIPFSLTARLTLQLQDQFIVLWEYATVFSTMAVLIYIPTNNTWEFLYTQYLLKFFFFNDIQSNWGELTSHYSLTFPW